MRRYFALFTFFLTVGFSFAQTDCNPAAHPQAVVREGKARFTILTPELIRIQYSNKEQFEDRATFAVVNRRLPVPPFTTEKKDGYLYIKTQALTLKYRIGGEISAARPSDQVLSIGSWLFCLGSYIASLHYRRYTLYPYYFHCLYW